MKIENQYIIAFKGLKEGSHDFVFTVGKTFLEQYEYLEARNGKLEVKVNLIKTTSHLNLAVVVRGFIEVPCDRCLVYFALPVDFTGNLAVSFSETPQEPDADTLVLSPEEDKIDLSQYIYESIGLSIPVRKVHPSGDQGATECDKHMLSRLGEHLIQDTDNHPFRDKLNDLL